MLTCVRAIPIIPHMAFCSKVSMHGAAARKVFADAGIDSTSRMVGLSFCGKRYTAVEMVEAIEAQLKPTGGVGQYQVYIYIY